MLPMLYWFSQFYGCTTEAVLTVCGDGAHTRLISSWATASHWYEEQLTACGAPASSWCFTLLLITKLISGHKYYTACSQKVTFRSQNQTDPAHRAAAAAKLARMHACCCNQPHLLPPGHTLPCAAHHAHGPGTAASNCAATAHAAAAAEGAPAAAGRHQAPKINPYINTFSAEVSFTHLTTTRAEPTSPIQPGTARQVPGWASNPRSAPCKLTRASVWANHERC